jgi:hypothetical protein
LHATIPHTPPPRAVQEAADGKAWFKLGLPMFDLGKGALIAGAKAAIVSRPATRTRSLPAHLSRACRARWTRGVAKASCIALKPDWRVAGGCDVWKGWDSLVQMPTLGSGRAPNEFPPLTFP